MNKLLDILIPRFVTEYVSAEVATNEDGTLAVKLLHRMADTAYWDKPAYVCKVRAFNLFGFATSVKIIEVWSYADYIKQVKGELV